MPIRVRASKELGLVVVSLTGIVSEAEISREMTPLIDVPEYSLLPRLLIDTTRAESALGSTEVMRDGAHRAAKSIDSQVKPGTRAAIAATRDEFYGYGRMYQLLRGDSPVEFKVFHSLGEAEEWLELPKDYEDRLTDVEAPGRG